MFFDKIINKFPFFFRKNNVKKLEKLNTDLDKITITFDSFPIYGTEISKCKFPTKPISKLFNYYE